MSLRLYKDNVLRYWESDTQRIVFTYDAAGVQIDGLAYTPEQNARADAEAAAATAAAALDATRAAVKTIVTDLKVEKDRVQPVIELLNSATVTTAQIKDVARAAKRIADAAIDIAKLLDGRI